MNFFVTASTTSRTPASAGRSNSGGEIGSVSAASNAFKTHIGKQFKRVVNTLTIG